MTLEEGLHKLMALIEEVTQAGIDQAAPFVEQAMRDTVAHGDVTGATRASYRAMTATNAAQAAASGYAAAQALLAAGASHGGKALSAPSGITQDADTRVMVLTSFTDYQHRLEIDDAGEKAVLRPTLEAYSTDITRTIAGVSRERMR